MQGRIDYLTPDQVRGWAYDSDNPDDHLSILVVADGQVLGRGIADRLRTDLISAEIGRGDHGFAVVMDPAGQGDLSKINVFVESGGVLTALPRGHSAAAHQAKLLDFASDPLAPNADPTQYPVFILGPARSGTSALALAMLRSEHYQGYGEGHLLTLALRLTETIRTFYKNSGVTAAQGVLIRHVPEDVFDRMVRRGFVQLTRNVFPSGRWMDKTPSVEMVRAAPLMRELWPNARFLFVKRRMVENLISRQIKFPSGTLQSYFRDWAAVMQAWLDVRESLKDVSIEIEHLEMARNPEAEAERVATFLAMPQDAGARFAASLAGDHPEKTSRKIDDVRCLEDIQMTPGEKNKLLEVCDPVMAAYGYSYTHDYYATSA